MIGFTREAIPTIYRGRRYRSRLEAKWAAFFTLAGWQFEYEPMDLGSWSPCFLLKHGGSDAYFDTDVLVEVKPIMRVDEDAARKMEASLPAQEPYGLLLLGVAPWIDEDPRGSGLEKAGFRGVPDVLFLGWLQSERVDCISGYRAGWTAESTDSFAALYGLRRSCRTMLETWHAAGNAVQWASR